MDRKKILENLVDEVSQNNYFIPDDAWEPFQKMLSFWTAEIVITRDNKEVLLKLYDDKTKEFEGLWHIPGGYGKRNDQSIQGTVDRVSKREIEAAVKIKGILDVYKWKAGEHPYGQPLSIYLDCSIDNNFKETPNLKFFPIENLPDPIFKLQEKWIKEVLAKRINLSTNS